MAKTPIAVRREPESPEEYVPTPRERVALVAFADSRLKLAPAPRLKVEAKDGVSQLGPEHPDPALGLALMMEALGTADCEFFDGLLGQLANAGSNGKSPSAVGINFMLAVMKGIEPKDQIETMLAAQMAAVHMASMTFARRLAHVDNIPQQDSAERAFNKLTRTFTTQMEALKRYRSNRQQRVIVEHVTVNDGGQAIVGAVSTGGGASKKGEDQPHAKQVTHAPGEALPSDLKTVAETVSSARG